MVVILLLMMTINSYDDYSEGSYQLGLLTRNLDVSLVLPGYPEPSSQGPVLKHLGNKTKGSCQWRLGIVRHGTQPTDIQPLKTNGWNLEMSCWKRRLIFWIFGEFIIFGFYVTLQGTNPYPTKRERENHRLKSDHLDW